ncbi:hypothetical protein ACFSZS_30610 [Seohaeicola zhoushanensis]
MPQPGHFSLDEVARPEASDGEILVRNVYLSVDPAQRGWASDVANYSEPVPLGGPMRALAVAQVIASRAEGSRRATSSTASSGGRTMPPSRRPPSCTAARRTFRLRRSRVSAASTGSPPIWVSPPLAVRPRATPWSCRPPPGRSAASSARSARGWAAARSG